MNEAWLAAEKAFMELPRPERRKFVRQMRVRLKNEVAMLAHPTVEVERFVLDHPEGVKTRQIASHLGWGYDKTYCNLAHVMKQWGTITKRKGTWFPNETRGAQQQQSRARGFRQKGAELPLILAG